ncbi:hypothetical protein A2U01_0094721, partial [Trifolium medium]|nr:hypothetical protein [Trifolium medium]
TMPGPKGRPKGEGKTKKGWIDCDRLIDIGRSGLDLEEQRYEPSDNRSVAMM